MTSGVTYLGMSFGRSDPPGIGCAHAVPPNRRGRSMDTPPAALTCKKRRRVRPGTGFPIGTWHSVFESTSYHVGTAGEASFAHSRTAGCPADEAELSLHADDDMLASARSGLRSAVEFGQQLPRPLRHELSAAQDHQESRSFSQRRGRSGDLSSTASFGTFDIRDQRPYAHCYRSVQSVFRRCAV